MDFQTVLITGGAGFIGSHLADALSAEGCKVKILDNLSTGNLSNISHLQNRIEFVKGSIQDWEVVNTVTKGCDVVFHQAAVVSVPQTVEDPVRSAQVNDIGTLQVLEAARKHGIKRVVLASSCAVYGDDPQLPKREAMIPKPLTPYAVQKLFGEANARIYSELYGLETVCLRYFNVFGPRQDSSSPYSGVISIFMTKATSRSAPIIYGDGNQYRDFIFVSDVVRANLLAASAPKANGKVFNIGTGSFVRINQLWKLICSLTGFDHEPEYHEPRLGDIRESLADIEQAKSALGFIPQHSFEKGLEQTWAWYKFEQKR